MKYHLVDGKTNPTFNGQDVVTEMEKLGYRKVGENLNEYNRAELQGQPIFAGLCGPMWDSNDTVRYETPEMNDILSR